MRVGVWLGGEECRCRGSRHRGFDNLIELQRLNAVAAPERIAIDQRANLPHRRDRHAGVQAVSPHRPALTLAHLKQLRLAKARDRDDAQVLAELPAFRGQDLLGRRAGMGREGRGEQQEEQEEEV